MWVSPSHIPTHITGPQYEKSSVGLYDSRNRSNQAVHIEWTQLNAHDDCFSVCVCVPEGAGEASLFGTWKVKAPRTEATGSSPLLTHLRNTLVALARLLSYFLSAGHIWMKRWTISTPFRDITALRPCSEAESEKLGISTRLTDWLWWFLLMPQLQGHVAPNFLYISTWSEKIFYNSDEKSQDVGGSMGNYDILRGSVDLL